MNNKWLAMAAATALVVGVHDIGIKIPSSKPLPKQKGGGTAFTKGKRHKSLRERSRRRK